MKHRFLIALILAAPLVSAQEYTIQDLGPMTPAGINLWGQVAGNLNDHAVVWSRFTGTRNLGLLPGGTFSRAAAINDLGTVAGTADGAGTVINPRTLETVHCPSLIQPFLWTERGHMQVAPAIPLLYTPAIQQGLACVQEDLAAGMNFKNQVVGSNRPIASYLAGFLWDASKGVSVVGSGYQDAANAINNLGTMVGQTGNFSAISQPVLWQNGVATLLGSLGPNSKCGGASSINDLGQVVGWSQPTSGNCIAIDTHTLIVHAALWNGTAGVTDLGTLPGDSSSSAVKINLLGIVVGNSGNTLQVDATDRHTIRVEAGRPFVWSKSRGIRDLNTLINPHAGWVLESAADINLWGQIVGSGIHNGQERGYLLTPRF